MRSDLRDIINCLNSNKVRATYGAVADLLDVPPIGVESMLGGNGAAMHWLVGSDSGRPIGYAPVGMHTDLFQHQGIISRAEELAGLLASTGNKTNTA